MNAVTIRDGNLPSGSGGAIFNAGTVTINNSTITANNAISGGGLWSSGSAVVTLSGFSANMASGGGAAITSSGCTATLRLSQQHPGRQHLQWTWRGIYNTGTALITDSTLTSNDGSTGGGLFNNKGTSGCGGVITVNRSMLSQNTATLFGGGITNSITNAVGAELTLNQTTLSGNTSDNHGGGIYNLGFVTVLNSTFSGNSSINDGGGIYNNFQLTLNNSTLADNSAGGTGGGILNTAAGTLNIKNSIVDKGTTGDNCAGPGSIVASGVNLSSDATCTGFSLLNTDPLLGSLQLNAPGTTATHALLAGSPAIDAVTDCTTVAAASVTEDQRGVTRPIDGDGDLVANCDIGAVEQETPSGLTLTVTTSADTYDGVCDADCSLREAITAANILPGANTIEFNLSYPATITLGSALPDISDDLTLDGPGASSLTISGNDTVRVLRVFGGVNFTLNAVTIADGYSPDLNGGGGLYNYGITTVNNAVFQGNHTNTDQNGGALFNQAGTLTINSSTITGNSANFGGGIMSSPGGTLSVTDSTFSGNSAIDSGSGGGINSSGTLTVTHSIFTSNTANGLGGGIVVAEGSATVSDSTFDGNFAYGLASGGAILNGGFMDSTLTVINSTFTNNYGDGAGGALFNSGTGTLNLVNSTVVDNSAFRGGGLWNHGVLTVTNSTISGNAVIGGGSGGGLYNDAGSLTLNNTILANSPSGSDCYLNGGTVTAYYSLIEAADASCNLTSANGNVVGQDPQLDPAGLQDNGGLT